MALFVFGWRFLAGLITVVVADELNGGLPVESGSLLRQEDALDLFEVVEVVAGHHLG